MTWTRSITMASSGPSVPSNLSKLTVPQLKALCKERRITGYSKLSKAALLQKLAEAAAPTAPSNDQASGSATASITPATEVRNPTSTESSTTRNEGNVTGVVHPATAGTKSTEASSSAPLPPKPSQNPTNPSASSTQKTSGTKGPAHTYSSAPQKRVGTSLTSATTNASCGPLVQRSSTSQQSAPPNDQVNGSATAVPSITPADEFRDSANTSYTESFTTCREVNVANAVHNPVQPFSAGDTESARTSAAKAPLPTEPLKLARNRTSTSTLGDKEASNTKRPAHTDNSAPAKRIRTSLTSATTIASHEASVPGTSTLQQKLPAGSLTFKVPELPAKCQGSHGTVSTLPKRPPDTSKSSGSAPRQNTGGTGRFKPLVSSRQKPLESDKANEEHPRGLAISVTAAFNFRATPLPVLTHISLPPRASERKWVSRWAIILSAISRMDRQTCMLVSRTFRYSGRNLSLS